MKEYNKAKYLYFIWLIIMFAKHGWIESCDMECVINFQLTENLQTFTTGSKSNRYITD